MIVVLIFFFSDTQLPVYIDNIFYYDGDIMCKDAKTVVVKCPINTQALDSHIVCGESLGNNKFGLYSDGQTCSCTWEHFTGTEHTTSTVTRCSSSESY